MTTASTKTSMHLNSINDILNSAVDNKIYNALTTATGYTSSGDVTYDKVMNFILDERTRELCGELYRWEDLARTKTLQARFNAFNDGNGREGTFDPATHYFRPIPQSFLDGITNESGANLTDEEKAAMQNPGY